MTAYFIKNTENVRTIEKENNVELVGKVLCNATRHLFGFWTGYVEIPVAMPTVVARWPLVRGLTDDDLEEWGPSPLEKVLDEAKARSLG